MLDRNGGIGLHPKLRPSRLVSLRGQELGLVRPHRLGHRVDPTSPIPTFAGRQTAPQLTPLPPLRREVLLMEAESVVMMTRMLDPDSVGPI